MTKEKKAPGGTLHLHLQLGQAAQRVVSEQQCGDEGEESTRRDIVIDRPVSRIGKDACDRQTGKAFCHRRIALRQARDLVGAAFGNVDDLVDPLLELAFHRERLDDGNALDRLLHRAKGAAVEVDGFLRHLAEALGKISKAEHQRRRHHEDDQAEQRILIDHHRDQRDERKQVACCRRDCQVHDVADAADILADLSGDLCRTRIVVEADGKRHQMRVDALLVARNDIVADLGKRHGLAIAGKAAGDKGEENRQADDPDDVTAPVGEGLIDDRAHDPGSISRRKRDDHKAGDRECVAHDVITAVLGDDALQHARDCIATDALVCGLFQKIALPVSDPMRAKPRTRGAL